MQRGGSVFTSQGDWLPEKTGWTVRMESRANRENRVRRWPLLKGCLTWLHSILSLNLVRCAYHQYSNYSYSTSSGAYYYYIYKVFRAERRLVLHRQKVSLTFRGLTLHGFINHRPNARFLPMEWIMWSRWLIRNSLNSTVYISSDYECYFYRFYQGYQTFI